MDHRRREPSLIDYLVAAFLVALVILGTISLLQSHGAGEPGIGGAINAAGAAFIGSCILKLGWDHRRG